MLDFLRKNQKVRERIQLLEPTKLLEREPCDSISFTHRNSMEINPYAEYAEYEVYASQSDGTTTTEMDINYWGFDKSAIETLYLSPIQIGADIDLKYIKITKYPNMGYAILSKKLYVINESGQFVYDNNSISGNKTGDVIATKKIYTEGSYDFQYHFECTDDIGMTFALYITFFVKVEKLYFKAKPIPSITDVINRILSTGITRKVKDKPKYNFDDAIAEKFKNVPAPEFFLPRMTVFEALMTVGHYIHGIPRLVSDDNDNLTKVTFDLLGTDEEYILPATAVVMGCRNLVKINDYCGALDSYAENIIDTQDTVAGSLVDPLPNVYKTTRCTSGIEIKSDTAIIKLDRPIYRLVKLEMAYTYGSKESVIGDITKYCYEQTEYDCLMTADNVGYPNSVAYALCWKQGSREITGLNTTSVSLLNLINSFKKPSIENIVKHAGKNFGKAGSYENLAFRVTYIPYDNVRVRQYKPYIGFPNDNVLYNQQSASSVEANAYGENLKGKIARLGNDVTIYKIRFNNPEDLPKPGNYFDGGYIFNVTKRYGRNYVIADIYVTPDFNKLSEYFGLSSHYRVFDVSERQSIDRKIIVPYKILISHSPLSAEMNSEINDALKYRFMDTFDPTRAGFRRPGTTFVFRCLSDTGEQLGKCYVKGITKHGFGNSLYFNCALEDNYSVGDRSADIPSVEYKQRKATPYGSVFGEFYALEYAISDKLYYQKEDGTAEEYVAGYEDQSGGICDTLPMIEDKYYYGTHTVSYISSGVYKSDGNTDATKWGNILHVDKNSSERLSFTFQLYGQCDDRAIVMGPAMWSKNALVTSVPNKKPRLCLLRKRLNGLRNYLDKSDGDFMGDGDFFTILDTRIQDVKNVSDTDTYVGWALVDADTKELYLGENVTLKPGETAKPIYFNF